MAKKVYDILPPKETRKKRSSAVLKKKPVVRKRSQAVKKEKEAVLKKSPVSFEKSQVLKNQYLESPKNYFSFRNITLGVVFAVILLGGYLFVKLPKAEIEIYPITEKISLEESITAEFSREAIDSDNKIIPASYLSEEQSLDQEFLATGADSTEGRSSGTIIVYNKITPLTPFTLIKGTRFLSNEGKIFTIKDKITVPPAKYQGGKLVEGSIEVEVQASKSGEDFNIDPSSFSVPGLSGTAYYYNVYASSQNAMKGGFEGAVKKVTQEDIEKSEDLLVEKLSQRVEEYLIDRLDENTVLLDGTTSKDVLEVSSSAEVGDVADKFVSTARMSIESLSIKSDDLQELVKKMVSSKLAEGSEFLPDTLVIDYRVREFDVNNNSVQIDLSVSADTYKSIDINGLSSDLSGKSLDQIKEVINSSYAGNASDVKVNFWPFWVNRTPGSENRIDINLVF